MEADDLRAHQGHPAGEADTAGDHLIADRLDALEAEKVMQRALELEAASLDEPHMITTEQLERIAKEIGVDSAFVHQALGEVRLAPTKRSRFAQWVLPEDILETATVSGLSRDDVDASVTKWMTQHEGLTPGGPLADGMEWDIDRRWKAKAIASSLNGGNRMSRVAGSDIAHRVHTISEHEHVVALQSRGRAPLFLAKVIMSLGIGFGGLVVLGSAVTDGFLISLPVFAVLAAASVAGGVAAARWWARGIRGALRRGLHGLVNRARPQRTKGNWFSRRRNKSSES